MRKEGGEHERVAPTLMGSGTATATAIRAILRIPIGRFPTFLGDRSPLDRRLHPHRRRAHFGLPQALRPCRHSFASGDKLRSTADREYEPVTLPLQ